MIELAYLKDLCKDFGTVLTAAACGLVAGFWFGLPGLAVGVLGGAGFGAWLFGTSSQIRYLEGRIAELEIERERREND